MVRGTEVESLRETDNMATGGSQISICQSAAIPGFYPPLADGNFKVVQKPKQFYIQRITQVS